MIITIIVVIELYTALLKKHFGRMVLPGGSDRYSLRKNNRLAVG